MQCAKTLLLLSILLLSLQASEQQQYDMQMVEGKTINAIQCLTDGTPSNPESAISMFMLENGCKAIGQASGDAGLSSCNIALYALYCGDKPGQKIYGWVLGPDKAMGMKGEAKVLVQGSQNKYITIPSGTSVTAVFMQQKPQEE